MPINWVLYVGPDGRCPVDEYLKALEQKQRGRLTGLMKAFARHGCWSVDGTFVNVLKDLPTSKDIYELSQRRERIIFYPDDGDAVALCGFTRKDRSTTERLRNAAASLVEEATNRKKGIVS